MGYMFRQNCLGQVISDQCIISEINVFLRTIYEKDWTLFQWEYSEHQVSPL